MPRTRGESIFFTAITAWMMVYVMTLYNTVLATGNFTNTTFLIALKGMWVEYIIIGLLAYFVSGHLAKMCAFRVVQPGDRPIFIIFAIQTFTVIWQVAFVSVICVYHGHGFTANFIPDSIGKFFFRCSLRSRETLYLYICNLVKIIHGCGSYLHSSFP